jgi:5-methylcytosine-specific restriction endonuclease McrA
MGVGRSTLLVSQQDLARRRRRLERTYGRPLACYLCGMRVDWETAELDHIIPRIKQGSDEPDNRAWACIPCNRSKGDQDLDEFLDRVERIHGMRHNNALCPCWGSIEEG